MLPIRPALRIVLSHWSPHPKLHVLRRAATLRTLAPHTKTLSSPNARNPSISRLQQVVHHMSSAIPSRPGNAKMPRYSVRKVGPANTLEHRIFIEKDGVPVSAFHDIPLYANEQQTVLNMIVEIPRWTNGKLEVSYCSSCVGTGYNCLNNGNAYVQTGGSQLIYWRLDLQGRGA